jgi:hypothetical protein
MVTSRDHRRRPDHATRRRTAVAVLRRTLTINQLITVALAEKLSALETEDYLAERAARATKAKFHRALRKIPDVEPEPHDRA